MDRDEVNHATEDDSTEDKESSRSGDCREPARPDLAKAPDAISYKYVTKNEPDIEVFVVRQRLKAHLEAEGEPIHGAESEKEPPVEPGRECQSYQDERPFKTKRKTNVANDVIKGGWLDDVTPM